MKKTIAFFAAALAATSAFSQPPPAPPHGQPGRAPMHENGGKPHPSFGSDRAPQFPEGGKLAVLIPLFQEPETAAKIGLDSERASAISERFADLDGKLKAQFEKLGPAISAQSKLLESPAATEEEIVAAVSEVWDIRKQVAILQTLKVSTLRANLTKEQLDKAHELLREQWEKRSEEWRKRSGEGKVRRKPEGRPGERREAPDAALDKEDGE